MLRFRRKRKLANEADVELVRTALEERFPRVKFDVRLRDGRVSVDCHGDR